MALYAFDGTNQKDNPGTKNDTNIRRFFEVYDQATKGEYFENAYIEGVGTRFGWFGKFVGTLFGAGSRARLNDARKALKRNLAKGHKAIHVIGFSRGTAIALEFTNLVEEEFPGPGS